MHVPKSPRVLCACSCPASRLQRRTCPLWRIARTSRSPFPVQFQKKTVSCLRALRVWLPMPVHSPPSLHDRGTSVFFALPGRCGCDFEALGFVPYRLVELQSYDIWNAVSFNETIDAGEALFKSTSSWFFRNHLPKQRGQSKPPGRPSRLHLLQMHLHPVQEARLQPVPSTCRSICLSTL